MISDSEKLAILTPLSKAVDRELKAVKQSEYERMRGEGIERQSVTLAGQKVGTETMVAEKTTYTPEIEDPDEFWEFALDYGLASVKKEIDPECMDSAIKYLERNLPEDMQDVIVKTVVLDEFWASRVECREDGCYLVGSDVKVPGVKSEPKTKKGYVMVRGCKEEDVIPAIQGIPGGIAALLGGAE